MIGHACLVKAARWLELLVDLVYLEPLVIRELRAANVRCVNQICIFNNCCWNWQGKTFWGKEPANEVHLPDLPKLNVQPMSGEYGHVWSLDLPLGTRLPAALDTFDEGPWNGDVCCFVLYIDMLQYMRVIWPRFFPTSVLPYISSIWNNGSFSNTFSSFFFASLKAGLWTGRMLTADAKQAKSKIVHIGSYLSLVTQMSETNETQI